MGLEYAQPAVSILEKGFLWWDGSVLLWLGVEIGLGMEIFLAVGGLGMERCFTVGDIERQGLLFGDCWKTLRSRFGFSLCYLAYELKA